MTTLSAVDGVLPPHRYPQARLTNLLAQLCLPDSASGAVAARFHGSTRVGSRHLALDIERYGELDGFTRRERRFPVRRSRSRLRGRFGRVTAAEDGVEIDGEFHARTVIGADGAESVVRRQCGARIATPGTTAVALRGYTSADPWPEPEQRLVMATAHWPAYAWVFPVGDGTANVGYGELIRTGPPTQAHLTERLHALLPACPPQVLRGHRLPLSPGRPDVGRGRVLLMGDAASLINPLRGEGIYYAVLSGFLAGAAAMTPDPADQYRRSLRRLLGRHLRHTDALARLTRTPALVDLGVATARDDQRAFDDLVEVGLAAGTISPALVMAMLQTAIGTPLRSSRR